jgi:hypothetical protein
LRDIQALRISVAFDYDSVADRDRDVFAVWQIEPTRSVDLRALMKERYRSMARVDD